MLNLYLLPTYVLQLAYYLTLKLSDHILHRSTFSNTYVQGHFLDTTTITLVALLSIVVVLLRSFLACALVDL